MVEKLLSAVSKWMADDIKPSHLSSTLPVGCDNDNQIKERTRQEVEVYQGDASTGFHKMHNNGETNE